MCDETGNPGAKAAKGAKPDFVSMVRHLNLPFCGFCSFCAEILKGNNNAENLIPCWLVIPVMRLRNQSAKAAKGAKPDFVSMVRHLIYPFAAFAPFARGFGTVQRRDNP